MTIHRLAVIFAALCGLVPYCAQAVVVGPDLYVVNLGNGSTDGSVFKISSGGSVSTFVGPLMFPHAVAVDASGNVYVGTTNLEITKYTPAGSGSLFASNEPTVSLAFDSSGNLFVANGNGQIDKITPAGVKSVFATGQQNLQGLEFDGSGNLFLADGLHTIYKFSPAGVRSTFAAGLNGPVGLTFDPSGNLYASDANSGNLYKYSPDGSRSTFATGLNTPWGLECDADGNLFVADSTDSAIYKYSPAGNRTTFASGVVRPKFIAFYPATSIPEPSAMLLACLGAAGVPVRFRRVRS
jgi:sugar lactone lactonase YvrE